jgi:hypothetical protein
MSKLIVFSDRNYVFSEYSDRFETRRQVRVPIMYFTLNNASLQVDTVQIGYFCVKLQIEFPRVPQEPFQIPEVTSAHVRFRREPFVLPDFQLNIRPPHTPNLEE